MKLDAAPDKYPTFKLYFSIIKHHESINTKPIVLLYWKRTKKGEKNGIDDSMIKKRVLVNEKFSLINSIDVQYNNYRNI